MKEPTAKIWICDSCNKEYGFTNEVNTPIKCTCGSTTFVPHTVKEKDEIKISEELTALEYLESLSTQMCGDLPLENIHIYGSLIAKESVERFARELCNKNGFEELSDDICTLSMSHIKRLAKQHGVNI